MIKHLILLLFVGLIFSQTPENFIQNGRPVVKTILNGENFQSKGREYKTAVDTAFVLSSNFFKQIVNRDMKNTLLLNLYKNRSHILDSISQTKNDIITRLENMNQIQTTSFEKLRLSYEKADSLIIRSTENTDRAIRQTYLTSVVVGSLGGGIIGANSNDTFKFNLTGALLGGVIGYGLNYLLLNL